MYDGEPRIGQVGGFIPYGPHRGHVLVPLISFDEFYGPELVRVRNRGAQTGIVPMAMLGSKSEPLITSLNTHETPTTVQVELIASLEQGGLLPQGAHLQATREVVDGSFNPANYLPGM